MKLTLKKNAPTKKKNVRPSKHQTTKKLSKEIIKRSCLKNKFLNKKCDIG